MSRMNPAYWVVAAAGLAGLLATEIASAHAFAQRYDLPVPLGLYLFGAGATVALSFAVMAAFVHASPSFGTYPRVDLLKYRIGRWLTHPALAAALRLMSLLLLVMVVLTGLFGNQTPTRNLAPVLVWVIWWVGLAYLSALLGNVWALLNPWSTAFAWAESLYEWSRPGRVLSRDWRYPQRLGVWPAALLLLAFAWAELVFYGSTLPVTVAWMTLVYSLITWGGMFLFGRERWLSQGEAFAIVFGVLARFAPTEVRVTRNTLCETCELDCRDRAGECVNCYACFKRADLRERQLLLRPFAAGLLRDQRVSLSMIAFVLLMLSTILFDGFMATTPWVKLTAFLYFQFPDLGGIRLALIRTFGLLGFWVLFLCIYTTVCWLMAAASSWRLSVREAAASFAYTLVPIALAYHLAHYLNYLLIQGQLIIPLLSDPFGYGWNLLGTAGYQVDIAVVGARFAWYTAVIAIVTGHVVAVYLAHRTATRLEQDRRYAVRSQYPMTALMVVYTVCGLWIVSQPIVEGGVPTPSAEQAGSQAMLTVPSDARVPEPSTGRLAPAGAGKEAKLKLTYRVMMSAFHDGSVMTVADVLYPYVFAYRWGMRGPGNDARYDPYVDRATEIMRARLVALRVTGIDTSWSMRVGEFKFERRTPIVEVYLNDTATPGQYAATIAPPWSNVPWHLMVLMEEAVLRGGVTFSHGEAQRRTVAWLDLVRDEETKRRLLSLLTEFQQRDYVPDALSELVSASEARERWTSLRKFYEMHGHFMVTNGPYSLKAWSEEATVLQVFRDLSYPLGVGSFDAFAIPRRAFITKIDQTGSRLKIFADIESVRKLPRSYEIIREPLANTTSKLKDVVCRYVVLAADGTVTLSGNGRLEKDKTFVVDLKDKLPLGTYSIVAALYVNGNTMNPAIRRIAYRMTGDS
jgi:hypothetical protein